MTYTNLEIYPTNFCQLSCSGCNLHSNTKSFTYLDIEKIKKIKILQKISKEISILGGEPTTWEYLLYFLKLCRSSNSKAKISITTNGLEITKDLIDTCSEYNIQVNVSWHNDNKILDNVLKLKKNKILDKIIIVPSIETIKDTETIYSKLSLISKCVYRPFIGKENYKNLSTVLNKKLLDIKENVNIESSTRYIDRKLCNNIQVIIDSVNNNFSYNKYNCKCGQNLVLYTDNNLYHCLSQAVSNSNPITSYSKEYTNWIPCNYKYCCCDTFDLRRK